MKNFYTVHLQRADLMELEVFLANALRDFLSFSSYSLYFPRQDANPKAPQWIARERSLLIPLWHKDVALGVFMARGVDGRKVKRLLPSLEALTALSMEYLLSIKQSRIDELTGLARMPRLLERMEHNADMVRSYLRDGMSTEHEVPMHKACMGLVVLRCPALDSLAAEFGYTFAHQALCAWTKALQQDLPQEVLAARSGENECTLLLPTATRTSCSKFIEKIMAQVDAVTLMHSTSKRSIRLHSVAGFALYPQDMEYERTSLEMREQAHHILQKARHATQIAHERSAFLQKPERDLLQNRYLAYARVVAHGGIIQEVLPLGQVLTNLGRYGGAKEGQHFSVWAQNDGSWQRKGELVLIQVRNQQSVGEILHQYDPAWSLEKGDNLRLSDHNKATNVSVNAADNISVDEQKEGLKEASNQLLSHGEFLQQWTKLSHKHSRFSLALVRLRPKNTAEATQEDEHIQQLLELYQQNIQENDLSAFNSEEKTNYSFPKLMGRYGETSLIFFHAQSSAQELEKFYKHLAQSGAEKNIAMAVGLASYPYLQAHKRDILEHCHKALELALLLKEPQVAIMSTLAYNISADQRYSRGDVFGAVEEYKLAILADANNAMAWNSLGVCMAALSRHSEARQYFKEALQLWKKNIPAEKTSKQVTDTIEQKKTVNSTGENSNNTSLDYMTFSLQDELAATLYNLGTVCQSLGEVRAAAKHFKECIKADAKHYFAHIRLGQLSEEAAKLHQARQYYGQAAELEQTMTQAQNNFPKNPTGMAYRYLARVALKQKKQAEARELLHETLLHNPQDAMALCMLADIYLQGGEDPAMAEMLARKSVGIRPEHAPAWHILAQSLRALGREDDALNAQDRAATL